MVSPISGALLSGEGLVESLRQTAADIAFLVPSIVQDLAQNPGLLDYCSKHLEAIIYCGGDLPQAMGDTIASRVRLLNQFGASELGLTPNILSLTDRGPEDWKYAQFHPKLGLELRHVADGIHELYAVRDPEKIDTQPTFTIFPNAQEYASRDLFVCHPSSGKPNLWSWQARADDIIVFLNGEKTNPISMEQHIVARNADISAALIIGAQRFQAALLIEPITGGQALDVIERAAFIEKIWPTVEEANKEAPSHARLMKSHVLFTQPQKPMLRAGKGTVQRSGTLKAYASEMDALYKDADTMSADLEGETVGPSGRLDERTVAKCVRQSVLSTVKWPELDETANFFSLGMDSLQALVLVRRLRRSLVMPMIALSTLYTNPSISALAAAILHLSDQDQTSKASQQEAQAKRRNNVIQGYKASVDKRLLPKSNAELNNLPEQAQETVILTGSTGTLGSYILDALLQNESVTHVYCLNRAKDSLSVQVKKSRLLGLQDPSNSKRTSFLTVDLSQSYFKLERAQYDQLMSESTLIVHNAWTVDFNLSLASFIPQLDNLLRLLEFATNCAHRARFLYMSSISSVMSYRSISGKTPEEPVTANTAPGPNGYAESKYVAEQIIDHASQRLSLGPSLAFARVGQIAGAAKHYGIWNKAEWFPSMIISSVHIGALPDSLGPVFSTIDWVPIDLLAGILVELALTRSESAAKNLASKSHHTDVYHPLNPHATTWTTLKSIILDDLSSRTESPMEVVPLRTWIGKVRKSAESMFDSGSDTGDVDLEAALRKNPAAKLLDFYEELAASNSASTSQLEHSETLRLSQAMRGLEPIKDEWVRKWMWEWFAP